MADDSFQNDFFGNQVREKKSRKSRLLDEYSKQRFLPHIRIPVEFIVIIAIGTLVLLIISYAVGIERGKRLSDIKYEKEQVEELVPIERRVVDKEVRGSMTKSSGILETIEIPKVKEKAVRSKKEEAKDISPSRKSGYIIQLASFKNEGSARAEIKKLKKKGVKGHLTKSGEWYLVYATGYRTISDAKKARQELIADYEDCYIRKVK
jgi:hypothetical protein